MDPAEVEFIAEKELVTIVPNFALDTMYLIGVHQFKILVIVKVKRRIANRYGHY